MGYGVKLLIMLVCISFVLFLAEQPTIFDYFTSIMGNEMSIYELVSYFFSTTYMDEILAGLGALVTGAIIVGTIVGNQNLLSTIISFAIPAVAVMAIANFFLMPIGNLVQQCPPGVLNCSSFLPYPFNVFFIIIMNIMIIATVYEFTSGRPL